MNYEKCVVIPYPDYTEFIRQVYNKKGFRTVARYLDTENVYVVPEDWFEGVMKKLYG